MPTKKRLTKPPGPSATVLRPLLVLLEEIRSQNRATIEAVGASHASLEQRIDQLREQTNARLDVLEAAVRQSSTDLRHLQGDVRVLAGRVEKLPGLDERVSALERRRA